MCETQITVATLAWRWQMRESEAVTTGIRKTTSNSSECYKIWAYFHKSGIDITVLQICIPLISFLILMANGVLLRRLVLKKEKTRPDKLFIILSLSDMGVGAFSAPSLSVLVFFTNRDVLCKLLTISQVFLYFPMLFSWFLVIIIAIDRSLMITKTAKYSKYITLKVLYIIIGILFISNAIVFSVISYTRGPQIYHEEFDIGHIIQLIIENTFMFTVAALYAYLLYYVRKKARKFENNAKHGNHNYSKQVTKNVFIIYLCLVVFTLPQIAGMLFWIRDPDAYSQNYLVIRNKFCWETLLIYCNSFINAIILLKSLKKR